MTGERCAVDSELALLYAKLQRHRSSSAPRRVPNPFFMAARRALPASALSHLPGDAPGGLGFGRREGHDRSRSLAARNRGKFVIDAGARNR